MSLCRYAQAPSVRSNTNKVMKSISIVVMLSLILQIGWCPSACSASVEVSRNETRSRAGLTAKLDAKRIGAVTVNNVVLKDNVLDIFSDIDATAKTPESSPVLTGTAFNIKTTTSSSSGKKGKIRGFVLLLGGSKIHEVDVAGATDSLTLANGETISGRITSADKYGLIVLTGGTSKEINVDQISSISSPRVFEFSVAITSEETINPNDGFIANGDSITFTSTFKKSTAKQSDPQLTTRVSDSSGRAVTARKVLVAVAVLAVVATAIAVPLALCLGNRRSSANKDAQNLANVLFLRNLTSRQPESPPPPPPPVEIP